MNDPRKDTKSRDNPHKCKQDEHNGSESLKLCILDGFNSFQQHIGNVMYEHNQWSATNGINRPTNGDQDQSQHVMDKHLPKVFAAGLEELKNEEGQVEGEGYVVVPPKAVIKWLEVRQNGNVT